MYIIEVIPIARGIAKDTLSYFSASTIVIGSFVRVPLRSKEIPALVIAVQDAREIKSEIKASDFELKKVLQLVALPLLSPAFMKAVRTTADYYLGTPGGVLSLLVPKIAFEAMTGTSVLPPVTTRAQFYRVAFQSDDEDRFLAYRSLIREQFARKKSVFMCLPTIEEVKRAGELLPKGIEEYTFVLHSGLTKKKLLVVWNEARTKNHPVLIIATGHFLAIPRDDLGAIVLEHESSRAYKFPTRPFLDVRTFAEQYAKELGCTFVVGDALLRVETLYRHEQGEFHEISALKFRALSPAQTAVVDLTRYKKEPKGTFQIISTELRAQIAHAQEHRERMVIFAARRGLATQTVCGDCGTVVRCNRCAVPTILHTGSGTNVQKNFFFCHRCGEKRDAQELCKKCNSWKLQTLGIGTEKIAEEVAGLVPSAALFRLDKDSAPTPKKAEAIARAFFETPGALLIGTETMFLYLARAVDHTAIASLDALFSLPDFRINERVMHLLLMLRKMTKQTFLVQTRLSGESVIEYGTRGNLHEFYRSEISARKEFNYPPFRKLIRVSLSGTRLSVVKEMEELVKFLAPFDMALFPAFAESARGVYTMHGLIRLAPEGVIPDELRRKLFALPPQFLIMVDPDSLL